MRDAQQPLGKEDETPIRVTTPARVEAIHRRQVFAPGHEPLHGCHPDPGVAPGQHRLVIPGALDQSLRQHRAGMVESSLARLHLHAARQAVKHETSLGSQPAFGIALFMQGQIAEDDQTGSPFQWINALARQSSPEHRAKTLPRAIWPGAKQRLGGRFEQRSLTGERPGRPVASARPGTGSARRRWGEMCILRLCDFVNV